MLVRRRRSMDDWRYSATASLVFLPVLAFAVGACDNSTVIVKPTTTAASTAVVGYVSQPVAAQPSGFVGYACAVGSQVSRMFDVVLSASENVNVDSVTIHLIEGNNVGGPAVTFPQAGLSDQFGSTLIMAGTSRTFRLQPSFPCGAAHPNAVLAHIAYLDGRGAMQGITVNGPFK